MFIGLSLIVQMWNGEHFEPTTLQSLGLRINIGHYGTSPCLWDKAGNKDFHVIHDNGVHPVSVDFCHCDPTIDHRELLLRSGWWPATIKDPQTCMSFSALRLFHTVNVCGKLPVYDFWQSLVHMTKGRLSKPPPDRYRVLLAIVRQYRHLRMCERAGRAYDSGGVFTTGQGELALACPACPHPGRNLPNGWDKVDPQYA